MAKTWRINWCHESAKAAQKMGHTYIKVFAGGVQKWKKEFPLVALTKEVIAQGLHGGGL